MTEDQKKQVATFRFGVIHELVNTKGLSRGEQEREHGDPGHPPVEQPRRQPERLPRGEPEQHEIQAEQIVIGREPIRWRGRRREQRFPPC